MIIIYNDSGLLVGVGGFLFGFVIAALTRSLAAGLFVMAAIWAGAGLLLRKPRDLDPYPHLYYIPLPFLAIGVAMLSYMFLAVEVNQSGRPPDPRKELLNSDERLLSSSQISGDPVLAGNVRDFLVEILKDDIRTDEINVFARKNEDAVLVLIKTPELKRFSYEARKQLVNAVVELLESMNETQGKKAYIGLKGRLTFGAIRTPTGEINTSMVVLEGPLYDFYGPPPAVTPDGAWEPGQPAGPAAPPEKAGPDGTLEKKAEEPAQNEEGSR